MRCDDEWEACGEITSSQNSKALRPHYAIGLVACVAVGVLATGNPGSELVDGVADAEGIGSAIAEDAVSGSRSRQRDRIVPHGDSAGEGMNSDRGAESVHQRFRTWLPRISAPARRTS